MQFKSQGKLAYGERTTPVIGASVSEPSSSDANGTFFYILYSAMFYSETSLYGHLVKRSPTI